MESAGGKNLTGFHGAASFLSWSSIGISIIGLLLNLINIAVFLHHSMRKTSINILLLSMAVADSAVLIFGTAAFTFTELFETSSDPWFLHNSSVKLYLERWFHPAAMMSHTASTYLLVLTTIERYIVVSHPLKARSLCQMQNAVWGIFLVFLFSVLYNLPLFFAKTLVVQEYTQTSLNCTGFCEGILPHFPFQSKRLTFAINYINYYKERNESRNMPQITAEIEERKRVETRVEVSIKPTGLGRSHTYRTLYEFWMYPIFMFGIPFTVLVALNSMIVVHIRSATRQRRLTAKAHLESTKSQRQSSCRRRQRREASTTVMLVTITVIFLVAYSPSWIWRLGYSTMTETLSNWEGSLQFFYAFCNAILVVNASLNFFIYCAFCKKFRDVLCIPLLRKGFGGTTFASPTPMASDVGETENLSLLQSSRLQKSQNSSPHGFAQRRCRRTQSDGFSSSNLKGLTAYL